MKKAVLILAMLGGSAAFAKGSDLTYICQISGINANNQRISYSRTLDGPRTRARTIAKRDCKRNGLRACEVVCREFP